MTQPLSHEPVLLKDRVVAAYACSWDDACSELRVIQPLSRLGMKVVPCGKSAEDAEHVDSADFVLLHREFAADPNAADRVIERAKKVGKPLVLTMDDLLLDVPPEHPAYSSYLRTSAPMLLSVCQVDAVITTTDLLAEQLVRYNHHVFVAPNSLDEHLWQANYSAPKKTPGAPLVLAYMGTATHYQDLALIENVLLNVLSRYEGKVVLKCLGQSPTDALAHHALVSWQPPVANYQAFVRAIQNEEIDIAVIPLADNLFNRCKSPLKFLEYSALGIPGVYSNIPPYAFAVRHEETGLLASTQESFERCLELLIENPEMRYQLGSSARRHVHDHHLLQKQLMAWQTPFQALWSGTVTDLSRAVPVSLPILHSWVHSAGTYERELEARQSEIYDLTFKLQLAELDVQELGRIKTSSSWKILHSIWRLRRHHHGWRAAIRRFMRIGNNQPASSLERRHQSLQAENESLRALLNTYAARFAELEGQFL